MALEAGTRIGPYEVVSLIGAGGMGEVCRARDTKLGRDVALKVLPDLFAADGDRLSRFQREAQLLAALNHPNIAAIYGLEDAPSTGSGQAGVRAIVMELVEGQTLPCPLPVDEALRVGKQIADAIEYAHDRGIIHRDLKPANIKVTPDGTVKVLDFGLAKAMDDVSDPMAAIASSMSPTLSLGATHAGVIMGTAAYMAPEQATGRPADRRSDIWSFGVVLYEMLTGAPVFGGESVPETLASVIKDPIAFSALPDTTPHAIRRLVARCLERDPRRRLQSVAEARIVIEDVIDGVSSDEPVMLATTATAGRTSRWAWLVAALSLLALGATIAWFTSRPAPVRPAIARYSIAPSAGTTLTSQGPNASHLAVSPDGKYVVWVADESGRDRSLWIRALDSMTAQRLERTDGAAFPFWSPDSKEIAYFATGKLMRVAIAGGSPHTICDAPAGEGGTWFQSQGRDGEILFSGNANSPVQRVLAQGGAPTEVTTLDTGETGHSFPQFLPDGRRFLYLARGNKPGIYVQTIGSKERTRIVDSIGRMVFASPGVLLYLRDATLFARRLNLDTLRLEGDPVPITEGVRNGGTNGRNAFSTSDTGVLAYRSGGTGVFQVASYARTGMREAVVIESGEYGTLSLSPDGNRLAIIRGTGNDRDLWVKELRSGVFSRLTSAPDTERDQVWSPDSQTIAYIGISNNKETIFTTRLGSGKQVPMATDLPQGFQLRDWTNDGALFVLRRSGLVVALPAPRDGAQRDSPAKAQTLVDERYAIDQIHVSPDGKWVAYISTESGQPEVTIASFPAFADRRQISSGGVGAVQPVWRSDGKELFYVGRDRKIVAVDIQATDGTLRSGTPHALFETTVIPNPGISLYAVSPDGNHFFIREVAGAQGDIVEPLYIVTNWTSLVGR